MQRQTPLAPAHAVSPPWVSAGSSACNMDKRIRRPARLWGETLGIQGLLGTISDIGDNWPAARGTSALPPICESQEHCHVRTLTVRLITQFHIDPCEYNTGFGELLGTASQSLPFHRGELHLIAIRQHNTGFGELLGTPSQPLSELLLLLPIFRQLLLCNSKGISRETTDKCLK